MGCYSSEGPGFRRTAMTTVRLSQVIVLVSLVSNATALHQPRKLHSRVASNRVDLSQFELLHIRGGSTSNGKKKKKKSKKKKKVKSSLDEEKSVIADAMAKDQAEALGDAIRDRADLLRSENPLLADVGQSIHSVGWALGTSDRKGKMDVMMESKDEEEAKSGESVSFNDHGGGVEVSPSSVVVNYFLKSHGGAHALQCLCSILASIAGLAAIAFHGNLFVSLNLLKRTMLFAMIKHVTGLMGAALLAARAIPDVGFGQARAWIEKLSLDPISQYLFYSACVLLWLPPTSVASRNLFFGKVKNVLVPVVLSSPVLLREIISASLVISDVMVLLTLSSNEADMAAIKTFLKTSQTFINAGMSVLVTPDRWLSGDPSTRQEILASLVSKVSLAAEVLVGLMIVGDSMNSLVQLLFGTASSRVPLLQMIKSLLCSQLYVHFLWSRRKKISTLATTIRGGSSQVPLYLLDILLDPVGSMGLKSTKQSSVAEDEVHKWSMKDYVLLALGLDE